MSTYENPEIVKYVLPITATSININNSFKKQAFALRFERFHRKRLCSIFTDRSLTSTNDRNKIEVEETETGIHDSNNALNTVSSTKNSQGL